MQSESSKLWNVFAYLFCHIYQIRMTRGNKSDVSTYKTNITIDLDNECKYITAYRSPFVKCFCSVLNKRINRKFLTIFKNYIWHCHYRVLCDCRKICWANSLKYTIRSYIIGTWDHKIIFLIFWRYIYEPYRLKWQNFSTNKIIASNHCAISASFSSK